PRSVASSITSTGCLPSMGNLLEQGSWRGHRRRPGSGYSHRRSNLVTRGLTTQVISGTVTPVVPASRSTSGRLPSSGAVATTTRVISGKIVTQVSTAILYGGGGGRPGWGGRVNQPSSAARN